MWWGKKTEGEKSIVRKYFLHLLFQKFIKVLLQGRNIFQRYSSSYLMSGSLASVLTMPLTKLSNKQTFLSWSSIDIGFSNILQQTMTKKWIFFHHVFSYFELTWLRYVFITHWNGQFNLLFVRFVWTWVKRAVFRGN